MATYDAFRQFGSGWGSQHELDRIGLLWGTLILLTGLSAVVNQLFYGWRIYVISKSRWMTYLISFVSHLVVFCT